jgi:tRNA pseudouridine38-40 synthase
VPRYAAEVSYDGARFYGWQRQPGLATVQSGLEDALTLLNGAPVAVAGAGRTDVGVHARGQVCTFDMKKEWRTDKLAYAVNANVPSGISVMKTARTSDAFHARFDAKSREYAYLIWNSGTIYPAAEPYMHWIKQKNRDWKAAARAVKLFEGEHDFGAFCRKADRPDDAVRTIYSARLLKRGRLVVFRVCGSGFLTNMVRIMAGAIDRIARGDRDEQWLAGLIDSAGERPPIVRTLPANALILWKINYAPSPWK